MASRRTRTSRAGANRALRAARQLWQAGSMWFNVRGDVVTIGTGAVIAAGSVVVHDVAPYAIVARNPAREVGDLLASAPSEPVR